MVELDSLIQKFKFKFKARLVNQLLQYTELKLFLILLCIGVATEFRSKKIPRKRPRTVSVIPRKKVLIPRFTEESIPKLGTEGNGMKYKKSCSSKQHVFFRDMLRNGNPRVFFCSRNGIPSCFLFRELVRNRIPSVCFYFCSTQRNSDLFSLLRNGSERNSTSLLLFLFHGTELQAFFFSAERFGTEFQEFYVRGTAGIPLEQTNCSVYSVFPGIMFSRKLPL